jgi:hypothetical protein
MKRLPALLLLAACGTTAGTVVTPAEMREIEALEAAARAAAANAPAPGPAGATTAGATGLPAPEGLTTEQLKKRDELDKRRTDLARRREDQARSAFELAQRRRRTELEHQSAAAQEAVSLEQAERELRQASEDLARFRAEERPRRLAEDALDLQQSSDGLLETREELAQLEMMYSGAELGDATAEIVLNRTRRRLQRAEERHALRERRSAEFRAVALPRDEESRVASARAKAVALENVRRNQEKEHLQREAALRDLDFDARKQEREVADLARDEAALERDVAAFTRELSLTGGLAAGAP